MKFHRIFLAIGLISVLGLTACDIVDNPIDPDAPLVTSGKKVLVEDFTGHQCGNCPRAHETAETLKAAYGDNLVVIGLHVGGFARVDSAKGYNNDFTTPFGDALDDEFGADNLGLPVGMVSRRVVSGSPLVRYTNWSTVVAQVLAEAPVLDIEVDAVFDAATRGLSITAELEYYQSGTADHRIVALITEDSILSKQADYSLQPDYITGYPQRHVVRKAVTNGVFGEPVKGAAIFIGERITKSYSSTLSTDWDEEKCGVVVYVLDAASGEILQVEEVHVHPQ